MTTIREIAEKRIRTEQDGNWTRVYIGNVPVSKHQTHSFAGRENLAWTKRLLADEFEAALREFGEELAILCEDNPRQTASVCAEKIRAAIRESL